MIRNLKVLLGATMALAAFGAVAASGAQAHTPAEFHCHEEPCVATLKPDGAGLAAHHVFVIKNSAGETVSFTCDGLSGQGTSSTKTTTSITITNLVYSTCKVNGQGANVRTNGCHYLFTAAGTVTIQSCNLKQIEIEIAGTGCIVTVGNQGPLTGIKYHNIGTTTVSTTEVTAEAKVPKITSTLDGTTAKCLMDVTKTPITAEYTTGNTIVTAETDPTGVMSDGWWSATVT